MSDLTPDWVIVTLEDMSKCSKGRVISLIIQCTCALPRIQINQDSFISVTCKQILQKISSFSITKVLSDSKEGYTYRIRSHV